MEEEKEPIVEAISDEDYDHNPMTVEKYIELI